MVAILSLLTVIVVSLIIVRVATVMLTLTGMSKQLARFQARSAFTGAGFTTEESEKVVRHPVRRRIIMMLMLLGNAGIVTAMSSLILSFVNIDQEATGITHTLWFRLVLLVLGLSILMTLASSRWLDRQLSRYIRWALKRWTDLEVRDYSGLLHLAGDYSISELAVEPGDWMANQKLRDLRLSDEGVVVLGIERTNGKYFGAPRGDTEIRQHDTLILYPELR